MKRRFFRLAAIVLLTTTIPTRSSNMYQDVTAFGAKGDGHANDGPAIQAAINAACQSGGSVFFPPPGKNAFYGVGQPQLPSVDPVFKLPCRGLHFLGSAAAGMVQVAQFAFAPMVSIRVWPGSNPNNAPVFALKSDSYTTFENLDISGYNQAVWLYGDTQNSFRNVCLETSGNTGRPDNAALKITNSFWIWYKGGCLISHGSNTTPIVLFTGEASAGGEAPTNGLTTIEDVVAAGGGMKYIQRVDQRASAGYFTFRNITIEQTGTDLLAFTEESGGKYVAFGPITFEHVTSSDASSPKLAVMSINAPSLYVNGVTMNHVFAGGGPVGGAVAIREIAGSAGNIFITSCGECVSAVVDGTGSYAANSVVENGAGFDFFSGTDPYRLQTFVDYYHSGPGLRFFASGNTQASLAIDSAGLQFNDGKFDGFNASITQSAPNTIDVWFSMYLPPGNVAAVKGNAVGTLSGRHTYYVVASRDIKASAYSAASNIASVTLPPASSTTITWTPSTGGASTPVGYFVIRDPELGSPSSIWVAGAAAHTVTDTGSGWGCCWDRPNVGTKIPVLRLTPNGMAILPH